MSEDEEEPAPHDPGQTDQVPMEADTEGGVAPSVAMETEASAAREEKTGEGPMEKRTVFVSNLPPEATDAALKEKFSEVCQYAVDFT